MISQDLLDAYKGIQLNLKDKPIRKRPVNTKKFFILRITK